MWYLWIYCLCRLWVTCHAAQCFFFHILSPLVVKIVPVLQLPLLLLSESLLVILPFHLRTCAAFLLYGKVFESHFTSEQWLVEPEAQWQLSIRLLIHLGKFSWHTTILQLLCINILWFLFWVVGLAFFVFFVLCMYILHILWKICDLLWDVLELIFGWMVPGFYSHWSL